MKRLVIGLLLTSVALPAPACTEDKCKNPARTTDEFKLTRKEGPAMKCNAVVTCPGNGGRPANTFPLLGGDDPTIVDRQSDSWNESRCKEKVRQLEWINPDCTIKVSPELICLDVDAAAGGFSSQPSGVIVTVGGAATGDFKGYEDGVGGAGAFRGGSGEEGQGGI